MNFLVVIHILIAITLIVLVLIQDSKGGGALGIGGGSNSLLGATGAQSLYARMTRWVAVAFGITCIALSVQIARENRSVIDAAPVVNTPATTPPAATENTPAEPATPPATPENSTQPANK